MTASPKRIAYGVLGVLAVMVFGPSWCSSRHRHGEEQYNYEHFVKPNEAKIRSALQARLDESPSPVCVPTPRFPYSNLESRQSCDRCDALVEAGFLTRTVEAVQSGDSAATAVSYALTPAGQPLYTEAPRGSGKRGATGLCFGRVALGDVRLTVTAHFDGRVFVRHVPRVEGPHEILYRPQARTLGLPQLQRNQDTLPPQELQAWAPNGNFQSLQ